MLAANLGIKEMPIIIRGVVRMRVLDKGTVSAAFTAALVAVCAAGFAPAAWSSGPLAAAARVNDLDQSRQLITAGEDINLAEPDGTTPLLWAVYNSSPELVQLLLDAGADPNIPNSLDITPLLQASRNGDAGMISLLLANGARLIEAELGTESSLMAA